MPTYPDNGGKAILSRTSVLSVPPNVDASNCLTLSALRTRAHFSDFSSSLKKAGCYGSSLPKEGKVPRHLWSSPLLVFWRQSRVEDDDELWEHNKEGAAMVDDDSQCDDEDAVETDDPNTLEGGPKNHSEYDDGYCWRTPGHPCAGMRVDCLYASRSKCDELEVAECSRCGDVRCMACGCGSHEKATLWWATSDQ